MELQIEKLNGKREKLAEKLPLSVPFSISVTTANVCNLKCEFCAISDAAHKKNKAFLEMDTYKKFIDSLSECRWHLKQLVLVGLGEPLLNRDIVNFVKYAKERNVADKVHIVTNATLLTSDITDKLVDAGIDVLRVSVNGMSGKDYKKYTGVEIDFEELKNNIEYFNKHKKNAKIYVKIMDYMLGCQEREDEFYRTFDPICDVANVEYLTQMSTAIDYSNVADVNENRGLKGFESTDVFACPLPFYHIYFNAEGTISACCVAGPWSTPPALQMGDINEMSIDEIWHGKKFRDFHLRMLNEGRLKADIACKECKAYMSYVYPEDNIDNYLDDIIGRMTSDECCNRNQIWKSGQRKTTGCYTD